MPDPWLAFSLDAPSDATLPRPAGDPALDYDGYLGLGGLLAAGDPRTSVPDERAFIATHQLMEVAFRLMTHDLAVVAGTLAQLADATDVTRATEPLPGPDGPSAFWRPAMTAAARLRHTAHDVLPAVMRLLGLGADDDVLFSTIEFNRFRDALSPSSGFQTSQLRLIQRALGKGPLLTVPLYPGDTFGEHYQGCPIGHVALDDPAILRESGRARLYPAEGTPADALARLDDTAHQALATLAPLAEGPAPPPVRRLHADDVARVVARVRQTMGDTPDGDAVAARVRRALDRVVATENERRDALGEARRGAQALLTRTPGSCLAFVLDRVAATDAALHAPDDPASFLTVHRRTVRRHVTDGSGTGGGGMPYLVTSQRFLFPLLPALVAYADLSAAGEGGDDAERW